MTESVREAAERRIEQEERERRDGRLAELEQQERERRDRERREQEAERRLQEARRKAAELGARRRELEDEAEEKAADLARTLGELSAVDREHTRVLSSTGDLPAGVPLLHRTLGRWLTARLAAYLGGPNATTDPYSGASLAERDPLTPEDACEEVS